MRKNQYIFKFLKDKSQKKCTIKYPAVQPYHLSYIIFAQQLYSIIVMSFYLSPQ